MADQGDSHTSVDMAYSSSTFSICGYWGSRKETAAQCAARALPFLRALRDVDPGFGEWFELLAPRRPKTMIALTMDDLDDAFARGVNRRDTDRTVIREIGFRVSFWNGNEDQEDVAISISCGGYSDQLPFPNTCIIPAFGEAGAALIGRIQNVNKITHILTLMAQHLDIDWGLASWYELREALNQPLTSPEVGWVTYFSSRFRPMPPLPPPTRLVPVEGHGTIIVLTDERFSVERPDRIELARDVVQRLKRAKVLPR